MAPLGGYRAPRGRGLGAEEVAQAQAPTANGATPVSLYATNPPQLGFTINVSERLLVMTEHNSGGTACCAEFGLSGTSGTGWQTCMFDGTIGRCM